MREGNGNVASLASATAGTSTAQYEYGPFGEPIRVSGTQAKANPFRWSTKYTDDESGLVYYGYRFYSPSTGRWISRNPIGETGGMNVYAVSDNQVLSSIDPLGTEFTDLGTIVIGRIKLTHLGSNQIDPPWRAMV